MCETKNSKEFHKKLIQMLKDDYNDPKNEENLTKKQIEKFEKKGTRWINASYTNLKKYKIRTDEIKSFRLDVVYENVNKIEDTSEFQKNLEFNFCGQCQLCNTKIVGIYKIKSKYDNKVIIIGRVCKSLFDTAKKRCKNCDKKIRMKYKNIKASDDYCKNCLRKCRFCKKPFFPSNFKFYCCSGMCGYLWKKKNIIH
jgi:hypothetical protein